MSAVILILSFLKFCLCNEWTFHIQVRILNVWNEMRWESSLQILNFKPQTNQEMDYFPSFYAYFMKKMMKKKHENDAKNRNGNEDIWYSSSNILFHFKLCVSFYAHIIYIYSMIILS